MVSAELTTTSAHPAKSEKCQNTKYQPFRGFQRASAQNTFMKSPAMQMEEAATMYWCLASARHAVRTWFQADYAAHFITP